MLYWLARTLRERRERTGASRESVRMLIPGQQGNPVNITTVNRFEDAEVWPRDVDVTVRAYALVCDVEDARELWEQALKAWFAHGAAPRVADLSPALQAVLLSAEAHRRTQPYDGESQGKPTSIRKRRAES